jgi:hypothetical protein
MSGHDDENVENADCIPHPCFRSSEALLGFSVEEQEEGGVWW